MAKKILTRLMHKKITFSDTSSNADESPGKRFSRKRWQEQETIACTMKVLSIAVCVHWHIRNGRGNTEGCFKSIQKISCEQNKTSSLCIKNLGSSWNILRANTRNWTGDAHCCLKWQCSKFWSLPPDLRTFKNFVLKLLATFLLEQKKPIDYKTDLLEPLKPKCQAIPELLPMTDGVLPHWEQFALPPTAHFYQHHLQSKNYIFRNDSIQQRHVEQFFLPKI